MLFCRDNVEVDERLARVAQSLGHGAEGHLEFALDELGTELANLRNKVTLKRTQMKPFRARYLVEIIAEEGKGQALVKNGAEVHEGVGQRPRRKLVLEKQ